LKPTRILLLAVSAAAWAGIAPAADVFVSVNGVNTADGLTPATAVRNIQFAYENRAQDGDRIIVLPGTYNECVSAYTLALPVPEVRNVHIVAQAWLDSQNHSMTIIDGGNQNCPGDFTATQSVVTIGGSDVSLEGFTIRGGIASGVFGFGSVVITNNVITDNSSTRGGGIYVYPGTCAYGSVTATIENNSITNNESVALTAQPESGDGGGIYAVARANDPAGVDCIGGNATVEILNNSIVGNTAGRDGGGALAFTNADGTRSASIVVTQNTIDDNSSNQDVSGYGGGAYFSNFGVGTESADISLNTIRDNRAGGVDGQGAPIVADGGGMSTWIQTQNFAHHTMVVADNTLTGNSSSGGGGGLDVFVLADSLLTANFANMTVRDNIVTGNTSESLGYSAGGILATFIALRSSSPSNQFLIEGNRITGNVSGFWGGGIGVLATADADPTQSDEQFPSEAIIELRNNRITENFAEGSLGDETGAGVFVYAEATGEAEAGAILTLNTISANTASPGNTGGVHAEGFTAFDSLGSAEGLASVTLDSSIVTGNTGIGIGGPTLGGGTANFTRQVAYTDLFGNSLGNNDGAFTTGAGMLNVDPELDAATFQPLACSPTIDAANPLVDFSAEPGPNGGRANLGHTGATAQATPSLADTSGDGHTNGIDVIRVASAFGTSFGQNRYDQNADLDGNGMVDGDDLSWVAGDFGESCP